MGLVSVESYDSKRAKFVPGFFSESLSTHVNTFRLYGIDRNYAFFENGFAAVRFETKEKAYSFCKMLLKQFPNQYAPYSIIPIYL